jgi:cobalt/nickel transport system permease protein
MNMMPEWMKTDDCYVPPKDGGTFAVRTIRSIGGVMSRLKIQKGHEKGHPLPALVKLFLLVALLILLSVSRNDLILLLYAAVLQMYLCTWPPKDILAIVRSSGAGAILALVLFLPAMIQNPSALPNQIATVAKVFLSLEMVCIYHHTTQWNHITRALKKLHIPGIFIFTIDITLKYIVLLGTLIEDMLTALLLRSVGKNNRQYQSVGGVMGVTFIKGTEMSREMYEAMRCRGFTDDYNNERQPLA